MAAASDTMGSSIPPHPPRKRAAWTRWITPPYLIFAITVLVSIRGWSFLAVPLGGLWIQAEKAAILLLLSALLLYRGPGPDKDDKSRFGVHVAILLFLSTTTWIPLYLYNDQNLISSFNASISIFYWLLYRHLRGHRIDRNDVLKFSVAIGLVWAFLTVVQQFTYPRLFLFYTRYNPDLPEPIENRAGVLRFMVDGFYFAQLALFWSLVEYIRHRKFRHIAMTAFLLVGTYYAGTRQLLFYALAGCMLIVGWHMFRKGKRLELTFVLAFLAVAAVFLAFGEQIFGKLIEMTKDEANEDNIRVASFHYFMFEHWPHRLNFLLGNGMPKYMSAEGLKIRMLIQKGFFQSDVGIAGTISVFGLFFTIASTFVLAYGTLRRTRFQDSHLKSMFLYLILGLPLSALFVLTSNYPFFCILFHLMDGAINEQVATPPSKPEKPVRRAIPLLPPPPQGGRP